MIEDHDRAADVFAQVAPDGFEMIDCPGCGQNRSTVARQGKDWVLHQPVVLTIVRCSGCGLHYLNPRPRMDSIGQYYPADYHSYQMRGDDERADGKAGANSIKQLALREAFGAPSVRPAGKQRALARTALMMKRPESFGFGVRWRGQGRLLDFGCGGGKFLRRMHGLGWNVTGIDFSETSVQAVRDAGLKAVQGTLPHAELAAASFDVVTMRHALEHVPDPVSILRAAVDLLVPGGQLVIQVPNYDAWDIDYFGDAAVGLDVPRHLIHFTPPTLAAMVERAGFRSVRARAHARSSWIRKAAKNADRGPRRKWAGALRSSLVCRLAAGFTSLRGRGNEIIATAEKPA